MLQCSANGEPKKYDFHKWVHYAADAKTVIQEYISTLVDHGEAYLIFQNTSYMDSGVYECRVDNGIVDFSTGLLMASSRANQLVKGTYHIRLDYSTLMLGISKL